MPATLVGLLLIIAGIRGFPMGCVIFPGTPWSWSIYVFATIYRTPVTLSGTMFNILMGFAGAAIAASVMSRDPFWMMSARWVASSRSRRDWTLLAADGLRNFDERRGRHAA